MGLSSTFNDRAGGSRRHDGDGSNHDRGYGGTLAGFDGSDAPQDAPGNPAASAAARPAAVPPNISPLVVAPIVLPTQFDGIPEKERDKRIDALRKLIDQKLADMTRQLALAAGSPGAVAQWYADNAVARVYENVAADRLQSQADLEPDLPSALSDHAALDRIQTRHGNRMSHKEFFDGLMGTRPEYTWLGSLSGKLANEQETFLRDLRQAGEKVLALAAAQVAKAQEALDLVRAESWQNFSGLQDFYAAVTTEIMERNPDGVLAAVRGAITGGVSARDARALLEKPVRGHASVIDALSAFSLSPREEMEIAARIMVALDDDFEAMNFVNNTIQTLKDPARRKNYQGYADAFVGNYVPTGRHAIFNADAIMDARRKDGALVLDMPGKNGTLQWQAPPISKEDADSLLRQLFRRRNFFAVTEIAGFNTDNIISIAYDPLSGALKWQSRGGPDGLEPHFRPADRQAALHALSDIADKPGFLLLPEGSVLNTRHVRSIGYDADRGELTWKTSGGVFGYADNRLPMTQADAVKVLVHFARRPDMTMLSLTDFVATASIHSIEYNEEQGRLACMLRGGPNGHYESFDGPADKRTARALIDALGSSGRFHRFNSHSLLNADIVQAVAYDESLQRLVYRLTGGRAGSHELWADQSTPQQARAALSAFAGTAGFGEYVQPNKDAVLNVGFIQSIEFLRGGTLAYCLTGGKNGCTALEARSDEATAKAILKKLSDSGKYVETKPRNLVEKAAILSAWHEPRKFSYQTAGGEHGRVDRHIPMSMADTARIQEELAQDPDLHMLGQRLVRLSRMIHAEYDPESQEMSWTMAGGREGVFTDREKASPQEARKLLRALRVHGQRDYLARHFRIAPEDLDITIANARAADKGSAAKDAGGGSLVEYVPWVVFASSSFISDPDAGLGNMKIDFPQSELNEIAGRKNPLLDLIPKKRKGVSSENDFSSLLDMIDGAAGFDDDDGAGPALTENNDSSNEILALAGPGNTLTPELQIFINEEAMDAFWGTDKAFAQFEAAKAAEFLDALASNGAVRDAAARWTTLGDTEKLAVLDNLSRLQGSIYGFDAMPVISMLEAPQGALLVNARFNRALDEKGCIEINVHPKSTLKDFARAVASVVHENSHNWQHQLAAAIADGTLQKGDTLYRQARDFQLALATQANVRHSFGQYLAESTERHARKAAGAFHAALTARMDGPEFTATTAPVVPGPLPLPAPRAGKR